MRSYCVIWWIFPHEKTSNFKCVKYEETSEFIIRWKCWQQQQQHGKVQLEFTMKRRKKSIWIRLWLFVIYGERCEEGCEKTYNFFLHSNSCTLQLIAWNVAKMFYQRKLESERNNIVQIQVYRVFHGIPRTFFYSVCFSHMKFERLHNICTLLLSP